MSIAHLLEDFSGALRGTPVSITDVSLEEERLASFEKGYQAGWDDAAKSQAEDQRSVTADLAQNLQDLTFTYEEAHAAVLQSLRPLLEQMIAAVLPGIGQETLVPRLAELLRERVQAHGRQAIEIVTATDDMTRMEILVEALPDMQITLRPDDTLARGQLYLRFGDTEEKIDLKSVLDAIEQAVSGFFEENRKAIA